MVSIKIVIAIVLIAGFALAGGVGVASASLDRVKFEAAKIRSSINSRKNNNG